MINIRNINKTYRHIKALNINSIDFEEGKSYGIVGPNGAGKTTLFKCMTNIIVDYKGEVLIDGVNLNQDLSVLKNVGLVLDGMSLFDNLTGRFNIEYFAGLKGQYSEEHVQFLVNSLELNNFIEEKVKNYSYGMKKKLILLIALIHMPRYLILDEPFRGLDYETVQWFKEYLKNLNQQGVTLLISSHVLGDINELCDEVYVLSSGQISKKFDLNEMDKSNLRQVITQNNARTFEIFKDHNLEFTTFDNGFEIDISQDNWNEAYAQLLKEGIIVDEIKKINVLKDRMN